MHIVCAHHTVYSTACMVAQSGPSAKGLTDKRDYNSFLVMVDPAGKLASTQDCQCHTGVFPGLLAND